MYKVNCIVVYKRVSDGLQVLSVTAKRRGYTPTQFVLSHDFYNAYGALDTAVRKTLKNNRLYADKWETPDGYWSDIDYIDITDREYAAEQLYIARNGAVFT